MANVPISNLTTTWNDGATTFSGVKLNVTDTASASGSLLMDLQVGGTSFYKFGKGQYSGSHGLIIGDGTTGGGSNWPYLTFDTAWGDFTLASWGGGVRLGGAGFAELLSDGNVAATPTHYIGITAINGVVNASLFSDNANCFDQRNSTNAQTFRIYNTADGSPGSNYERGFLKWADNASAQRVMMLGTEKGGTGTARALELQTDGTTRLTISDTGGATFTGSISTASNVTLSGGSSVLHLTGSSAQFRMSNRVRVYAPNDGILIVQNNAQSDFDRLCFGNATSSFPALKRSSTTLICRLGDDSANAAFESASLKTDAPTGGTAATWKLGAVASVTPTSPDRTIEVDIGGTIYYLHAKTTND